MARVETEKWNEKVQFESPWWLFAMTNVAAFAPLQNLHLYIHQSCFPLLSLRIPKSHLKRRLFSDGEWAIPSLLMTHSRAWLALISSSCLFWPSVVVVPQPHFNVCTHSLFPLLNLCQESRTFSYGTMTKMLGFGFLPSISRIECASIFFWRHKLRLWHPGSSKWCAKFPLIHHWLSKADGRQPSQRDTGLIPLSSRDKSPCNWSRVRGDWSLHHVTEFIFSLFETALLRTVNAVAAFYCYCCCSFFEIYMKNQCSVVWKQHARAYTHAAVGSCEHSKLGRVKCCHITLNNLQLMWPCCIALVPF